MNLEVLKQRKEIQEYKGKEKKSLEQISAVSQYEFIYSQIKTKLAWTSYFTNTSFRNRSKASLYVN